MAENLGTSKSKFANAGKNFGRFFKDVRNELKKVIWPTREQLVKSTLTVLAVCLLSGIIIWITDGILTQVMKATLGK